MNVNDYSQQSEDFKRIEKAIRFIEVNFKSQPRGHTGRGAIRDVGKKVNFYSPIGD